MQYPSSAPAELSSTERRYGCVDPVLRSYLHTKHPRPAELHAVARDIVATDHAILLYGSGWAAADAALCRTGSNRPAYALEDRQDDLTFAATQWEDARNAAFTAARSAQGIVEQTQQLDIMFRSSRALAHLPLMRTVSEWFSGAPVDSEATREQVAAVRQNMAVWGRTLLKLSFGNGPIVKMRSQLVNETSAELLVLRDDPLLYGVLPASLRYEQSPEIRRRASLVAVAVQKHNHPRMHLQVANAKVQPAPQRFGIVPQVDLRFGPSTSHLDTVRPLLMEAEGEGLPGMVHDRLSAMSQALLHRLVAYDAEQQAKVQQTTGKSRG